MKEQKSAKYFTPRIKGIYFSLACLWLLLIRLAPHTTPIQFTGKITYRSSIRLLCASRTSFSRTSSRTNCRLMAIVILVACKYTRSLSKQSFINPVPLLFTGSKTHILCWKTLHWNIFFINYFRFPTVVYALKYLRTSWIYKFLTCRQEQIFLCISYQSL